MAKGSGLQQKQKCSQELQELLGKKEVSRGELMKLLWIYIKKKKLQDGQLVNIGIDEKMKKVFGHMKPGKTKTRKCKQGQITMFQLAQGLSKHLS